MDILRKKKIYCEKILHVRKEIYLITKETGQVMMVYGHESNYISKYKAIDFFSVLRVVDQKLKILLPCHTSRTTKLEVV